MRLWGVEWTRFIVNRRCCCGADKRSTLSWHRANWTAATHGTQRTLAAWDAAAATRPHSYDDLSSPLCVLSSTTSVLCHGSADTSASKLLIVKKTIIKPHNINRCSLFADCRLPLPTDLGWRRHCRIMSTGHYVVLSLLLLLVCVSWAIIGQPRNSVFVVLSERN